MADSFRTAEREFKQASKHLFSAFKATYMGLTKEAGAIASRLKNINIKAEAAAKRFETASRKLAQTGSAKAAEQMRAAKVQLARLHAEVVNLRIQLKPLADQFDKTAKSLTKTLGVNEALSKLEKRLSEKLRSSTAITPEKKPDTNVKTKKTAGKMTSGKKKRTTRSKKISARKRAAKNINQNDKTPKSS